MAARPLDQLSPKYRARIERAMQKAEREGVTFSRQLARGHKKQEHKYRKVREIQNYGLTLSQQAAIREWVNKFNTREKPILFGEATNPDPHLDSEDIIHWAKIEGYEWFSKYRRIWESARKQYLKEVHAGTWASRGWGQLEHLTKLAGANDPSWLYYH